MYFVSSPTFTMMHLCITQCTYWTPLQATVHQEWTQWSELQSSLHCKLRCNPFVHSYFYSTSSIDYYSEALPTQHGYCQSFMPKRHRQQLVKDLPNAQVGGQSQIVLLEARSKNKLVGPSLTSVHKYALYDSLRRPQLLTE